MISGQLRKVLTQVSPYIDISNSISGQLDSLQIAMLLIEIEKEFKISLPTAELVFMRVLDFESLLSVINKKLEQQ